MCNRLSREHDDVLLLIERFNCTVSGNLILLYSIVAHKSASLEYTFLKMSLCEHSNAKVMSSKSKMSFFKVGHAKPFDCDVIDHNLC